jgi:hypothetical protein
MRMRRAISEGLKSHEKQMLSLFMPFSRVLPQTAVDDVLSNEFWH